MATLSRIKLSGFKSIKDMDLELGAVNVLIGANGAGKSNLLSFFQLLREIVAIRLQLFVAKSGGADSLLFYGAKNTPRMVASLELKHLAETLEYAFGLGYTASNTLVFEEQAIKRSVEDAGGGREPREQVFRRGLTECALMDASEALQRESNRVQHTLHSCHVHLNDTSAEARMRLPAYINDNRELAENASNLAPVLYRMKQTQRGAYHRVIATIRQIMPWFGDFVLEPLELRKEDVNLDWHERQSDFRFRPHQLPDGALRAMALVTLLLQPPEYLPSLIVIDEPELGLHPYAMTILAALLKQASHYCQIVVATQSPLLLDHFEPEDVVVVEREQGASVFQRLAAGELQDWLQAYTLAELWEKNVLGGGPV